jgi:hypothetical protein
MAACVALRLAVHVGDDRHAGIVHRQRAQLRRQPHLAGIINAQ